MGDSENGTEESGLPYPVPPFQGSPPKTPLSKREAVGADVSVISHREDDQCHSEARLTLKNLRVCSKAKWMMMRRSIQMTNHNTWLNKIIRVYSFLSILYIIAKYLALKSESVCVLCFFHTNLTAVIQQVSG